MQVAERAALAVTRWWTGAAALLFVAIVGGISGSGTVALGVILSLAFAFTAVIIDVANRESANVGANLATLALLAMSALTLTLSLSGVLPDYFEREVLGQKAPPTAGVNFTDGSRVPGAVMRDMNLSRAVIRNVDLSGGKLADSDLRGADLRGSCLIDAELTGADLRGALLDNSFLQGADLSGARLDESTSLDGATFDDATRWPSGFDSSRRGLVERRAAGCDVS